MKRPESEGEDDGVGLDEESPEEGIELLPSFEGGEGGGVDEVDEESLLGSGTMKRPSPRSGSPISSETAEPRVKNAARPR